MSDFPFNEFESSIEIKLPLTIESGMNLYKIKMDLNFVFSQHFDYLNNDDIEITFEVFNFNKVCKDTIFKEGDFKTKFYFSDLLYVEKDVKEIRIIFTFINRNFSQHTKENPIPYISLDNFNYIVKDLFSNKYYNSYSDPEFLYSYNSSVIGLIENQDKNAVHIYLNEKFKNILVVINQNIPFNIDWKTLNNIDMFNENYGLYYSKTNEDYYYELFPMSDEKITSEGLNINKYNPNNIVASNYIKTLNNINDIITLDTNIYYHYIDSEGNYASTMMTYFDNTSSFLELPNWINKFPPFLLKITESENLLLYNKTYDVGVYKGPNKNIKDQYIVYDNSTTNDKLVNEVFATKITSKQINKKDGYKYLVKRYSGYYEPIMKNISLFTPTYYWVDDDDNLNTFKGNYKFNTELKDFGIIKEVMYSKVNEDEYVLKLKETNELSLYPILDEVGLSQTSRNIFSSPWDNEYYLRTTSQFVLSDNSYNEIVEVSEAKNNAEIYNVKVVSGLTTTYHKGINIYGNLKVSDQLTFSFDVLNNSDEVKTFNYIVKYQSSGKSEIVISDGSVSDVAIDGLVTETFTINRPTELKNAINYEEYTKWYLVIELYGSSNNLYDYDNSIMFNVYNDIISFNMLESDISASNGFYDEGQTYYVDDVYDFGSAFTEEYNKLKNVKYTFNVKLLKVGVENEGDIVFGNYELTDSADLYDTIGTVTNFVNRTSNTETISFNELLININETDYNTVEYRNIIYEVVHYYNIEGETKYITTNIEDALNVSRTQEAPILKFLTNPTIELEMGECVNLSYSGDIVSTDVSITNLGGNFVGTVKMLFNLRENGTTIITNTLTKDITLSKGASYKFQGVILGPVRSDGEALITYSYKDYDVRVSTSYISGYVHSDYIKGKNDTKPVCN